MTYAGVPDFDEPLTDEERDTLIDDLAKKIVSKKMETPAILFLEMNKPISFIAGQSMIATSPFLIPLFGQQNVRKYSQLFSVGENVEKIIRRIEDLANERDAAQRSEKKT